MSWTSLGNSLLGGFIGGAKSNEGGEEETDGGAEDSLTFCGVVTELAVPVAGSAGAATSGPSGGGDEDAVPWAKRLRTHRAQTKARSACRGLAFAAVPSGRLEATASAGDLSVRFFGLDRSVVGDDVGNILLAQEMLPDSPGIMHERTGPLTANGLHDVLLELKGEGDGKQREHCSIE